MVAFSDIAVFILATTRMNGRHRQDFATYFESRIVPIRETWGQYFPSLYFVFGTNKFDQDFLLQQCRPNNVDSRNLASRDKQAPSVNVLQHYKCPIYNIEAHLKQEAPPKAVGSPVLFEFNAIWTGNCTGEYFGIGPTCRCQESMRYFNSHPSLASKEWMIFMDDDIYYRPYALTTLLDKITQEKGKGPVAVVAANKYRSFQFSKHGPKNSTATAAATATHNCKGSPAYNFPIAQPAMMNRAAMQRMSNGIDANALTGLHAAWGGTHDALLGVLLWMYQIPTYSISRSYLGGGMHMSGGNLIMPKPSHRANNQRNSTTSTADASEGTAAANRGYIEDGGFRRDLHFAFHRLSNFKAYAWQAAEQKQQLKIVYPGIYDLVKYLGEEKLYTSKVREDCSKPLAARVVCHEAAPSPLLEQQNDLLAGDELFANLTLAAAEVKPECKLEEVSCPDDALRALIEEQNRLGLAAYHALIRMQESRISLTVFASKAQKLATRYVSFLPEHCHLL